MDLFAKACRAGGARLLPPPSQKAVAGQVQARAGWDTVYPQSALSYQNGWILAGRSGLDRKVAVGWRSGKRPEWTSGLPGAPKEFESSAALFLEGTHETLVTLREALPFL